eukprot:superscaffoldBa00006096_g21137
MTSEEVDMDISQYPLYLSRPPGTVPPLHRPLPDGLFLLGAYRHPVWDFLMEAPHREGPNFWEAVPDQDPWHALLPVAVQFTGKTESLPFHFLGGCSCG